MIRTKKKKTKPNQNRHPFPRSCETTILGCISIFRSWPTACSCAIPRRSQQPWRRYPHVVPDPRGYRRVRSDWGLGSGRRRDRTVHVHTSFAIPALRRYRSVAAADTTEYRDGLSSGEREPLLPILESTASSELCAR